MYFSTKFSSLIKELREVDINSERYALIGHELSKFPRSMSTEGLMTSELKQRMNRTRGLGPNPHLKRDFPSYLYKKRGILIGFEDENFYQPKYFYETIYRKIFNTLANIDWKEVCRLNIIDVNRLRDIAVSDFDFDRMFVDRVDYRNICDLLETESSRRRSVRAQLKEGIPEARDIIYYQPGGRMMRGAETIEMFASSKSTTRSESVSRKSAYERFYQMCSDPNITKDQIFELAQEIDLEVLLSRLPMAAPTKDDYCRVLQNYIERTQLGSPQ